MRHLAVILLAFVLGAGSACDRSVNYTFVKNTNAGQLGWRPSKRGSEVPCVALKPSAKEPVVACPTGSPARIFAKWVEAGDESVVIGFLAPGIAESVSSGVGVGEVTPPIRALGGRRLFIQIVDDGLQTERTIRIAENPEKLETDPAATVRRP